MSVTIKTPEEIEKIRTASLLATEVLNLLRPLVVAGVTTDYLNDVAHRHITEVQGGTPATLGYHGFPKSLCTSLNHQVCHGIPGERKLVNGDILNIDVTVIKDGWYGDTSAMYTVGAPSIRAQRLIDVTYDAMMRGIEAVRPGATLGDIGHAIQKTAEASGFSVVREYCGHGLGRNFHEEPQILHYGRPGEGLALEPGMVFTIEPMINAGKKEIKLLNDGWTVVTKDHSLSAQWEHTVAVTETGVDILSGSARPE
ncbi:type I methionyl aminopeptidase [Halothiobacillus diazotrophicus]|uniref:Methionine aminopeptidase n=1 Tax=Halothiobacillus diazotrophicus TaxID=1860122 RepID=A0A191ZH85_9GAMM|nr:type I methionyl aminopeptidase [Halothiobacillus diazotrophicus]ANJ67244.1 type I methionyl aminopeptidase [Halothiobacillus diazotrophicus]